MRELKFRAWNGRAMEYGGFSIHASNGKLIPSDITNVGEGAPVMQYTGLKDSEGKDIYEDDVLASIGMRHEIKGVMKWDDSRFGWSIFRPLDRFIVIGNIHENPELLE